MLHTLESLIAHTFPYLSVPLHVTIFSPSLCTCSCPLFLSLSSCSLISPCFYPSFCSSVSQCPMAAICTCPIVPVIILSPCPPITVFLSLSLSLPCPSVPVFVVFPTLVPIPVLVSLFLSLSCCSCLCSSVPVPLSLPCYSVPDHVPVPLYLSFPPVPVPLSSMPVLLVCPCCCLWPFFFVCFCPTV